MAACLIAGGAGFLGSHLAEALLARGESVVVFDNFSHGTPENLTAIRDRVEVIPGDLMSYTLARRAIRGVDCVFHLGVPCGLGARGLATSQSGGALGTLRLLLAAREARCRRVVLASTGEVYGGADRGLVDESAPPAPNTPAAREASLAEHEAVAFARSFGLGLLRLRFFNVFGPRQGPGAAGPNLRRILEAMLAGKRPVLYDHELGDHDLLPVDEAVRACLLAGDSDRADGRIYNIGSGQSVNTEDLVARLNVLLGTRLPPLLAGPCSAVPPIALPDVTRAKVELAFSADFDLNDRLLECVNYYREQKARPGEQAVDSQFVSADRELDTL
jgi:UDP-glucose 4-epimerase